MWGVIVFYGVCQLTLWLCGSLAFHRYETEEEMRRKLTTAIHFGLTGILNN